MKVNFLLLILSGAALLASCSSGPKSYTVTGTLPDDSFDGKTVYINNRDYNRQKIDTAVVSGSTFTFTGVADTAAFCQVSLGRLYANFILENGEIALDMTEPNKPSGTPLNDKLVEFFQVRDSLNSSYRNSGFSPEFYADVYKPSFVSNMTSFFKANLDNPIGILAFKQLHMTLEDMAQSKKLIGKMGDLARNTPVIQEVVQQIDAVENTAPGKMFVDFSIKGDDGEMQSLSDYVGKGKYVLVDFWASWCRPCREETPVIAELYSEYGNKGLDVLGVAVWDMPKDTREAIKELKITWPQIIDAGELPTTLYGIQGIPHIILFGPDGTILERDLRGDRMRKTVSALFE